MLGRWAAGASAREAAPASARPDLPSARGHGPAAVPSGGGTVGLRGTHDGGDGAAMHVDDVDADGFHEVRRGTAMGTAERVAQSLGHGEQRIPKRPRNYWADLSEQPEDGGDPDPQGLAETATRGGDRDAAACTAPESAEESVGAEVQRAEGHEGDVGSVQARREEDLRAEWQQYCQTCRALERDPATPARLLADARAQRDESERMWRAARTPHPLHKRMRWAEAELREAEGKEAAHQRELDAHLEQAARRTRELEARQRVDAARTARKRAALLALHKEGAPKVDPPRAERAARIAATGMGTDLIPALVAAVERLDMPLGEDTDAFRQELRAMAVSAARIEGVLREAFDATTGGDGPASFDIGDDGRDDGDTTHGAAEGDGDDQMDPETRRMAPPSAATAQRWTRQQQHGPWRKATSSEAAQAQAKQLLCQAAARGEAAAGPSAAGEHAAAAAGVGEGALEGLGAQAALSGATTNDLAEAQRRDKQLAEAQFQQAVLHRQCTEQQREHEELQRQQRQLRQQEELRRHQEQLQLANEARAAEEARQRDDLIARMSPAELARAAELHAQQAAVGSRAFGSREASELAGIAHRHHVSEVADALGASQEQAAVDALMEMSPEQFAEWERDQQGRVADGTGW